MKAFQIRKLWGISLSTAAQNLLGSSTPEVMGGVVKHKRGGRIWYRMLALMQRPVYTISLEGRPPVGSGEEGPLGHQVSLEVEAGGGVGQGPGWAVLNGGRAPAHVGKVAAVSSKLRE